MASESNRKMLRTPGLVQGGYRLEHIDIEVNHRCNLWCRHCSARPVKGKSPDELSIGEIRTILGGAKPLGLRKVGLTGGEPLFDAPKLEAVARFCLEELSVPVHMHTNGTLVTEELCGPGAVLSLFESVSVTFLGGNAPTHDAMTQVKGSFEKALDAANLMTKARLPLTCYFIPTRGTCRGFVRLADRLREAGVNRIRAMALAPSGRARPIYGETAPGKEELQRFEEDLLRVSARLGIHVEAGRCTRLSMPRLSALAGHDQCMSGLNRVHVNSKGDVFPCTAASGVKELTLGNLRKNGFRLDAIWLCSELIELTRRVRKGTLVACNECAREPKCRDSCIVNACGTMPEEQRMLCPLVSNGARQLEAGTWIADSHPISRNVDRSSQAANRER